MSVIYINKLQNAIKGKKIKQLLPQTLQSNDFIFTKTKIKLVFQGQLTATQIHSIENLGVEYFYDINTEYSTISYLKYNSWFPFFVQFLNIIIAFVLFLTIIQSLIFIFHAWQ